MYEKAIELLRNPEDYCDEVLAYLGSAFLSQKVDPLNLSPDLFSLFKELGVFFIQQLKRQPVTISNDDLDSVAYIKRWDVTERAGHKFVKYNEFSTQTYLERLKQEFEIIKATGKLHTVFFNVREYCFRGFSLAGPLEKYSDESLSKEIELFNQMDKDERNNRLLNLLNNTQSHSRKVAIHIIILCNQLFHLDKTIENMIEALYFQRNNDEAFDEANLQALSLLYNLKYVLLIVNANQAFLEKIRKRIEEISAAIFDDLVNFNAVVDALLQEMDDYNLEFDQKLIAVDEFYGSCRVNVNTTANKSQLVDIILRMLDDGAFKTELTKLNRELLAIKETKPLQLALQVNAPQHSQILGKAKELIQDKKNTFRKLLELDQASSGIQNDLQQRILAWNRTITEFETSIHDGNEKLSSRKSYQFLKDMNVKMQEIEEEFNKISLNPSVMQAEILALKKAFNAFGDNKAISSDSQKKAVADFVNKNLHECRDKDELIDSQMKRLNHIQDLIDQGKNKLRSLDTERSQFGKTIGRHGLCAAPSQPLNGKRPYVEEPGSNHAENLFKKMTSNWFTNTL